MLRFRQFIIEQLLILEDRMDFLKNKYKSINTDHDTLAQNTNPEDIINHFAQNADPSHNKAYTDWILNRYNRGDFRQEDYPRIREALSNFIKHRSKLPEKDINRYNGISDIEQEVEPHVGEVSGKEQKRKTKEEGADLVYSNNGVKIHH